MLFINKYINYIKEYFYIMYNLIYTILLITIITFTNSVIHIMLL